MPEASPHPDEDARIDSLQTLGILDTTEETVYDDVVRLAADVCEVPISLVSLVDRDRQWFKAKHGLDVSETPRCAAFCAHAILDHNRLLIIEDATKDRRFADNPLVTGSPNIRFYAGVPLCIDPELPIGTLCVISDQSKQLSGKQLSMLKMLGSHLESILRLRRFNIELRKSHRNMQRTQAALDTAADSVLWVAHDGRFTYANEAACQRLGYTRQELLQMDVASINPAVENAEKFRTQFWPQIVENKSMRYEMRHQRKDGTTFPVEIATHLIDFEEEQITCSFIRDITDRKQMDEKLQVYSETLQSVNSELEQFATIASHDLKQPLRGIGHLAQWAIEDAGDAMPDAAKEHLEMLKSRVARMHQLLDDLLAYSRAGSRTGLKTQFDVKELVEEVIELIEVPADLTICIDGEFPSLETHRAPLSMIFRNLIGNAVKYRSNEPMQITISAGQDDNGTHQFSVADTGIGIAPEYHSYVFGMFNKLSPAGEVESSGMGLAMIKKMLDARGGRISLASELGKGSKFTFSWPV